MKKRIALSLLGLFSCLILFLGVNPGQSFCGKLQAGIDAGEVVLQDGHLFINKSAANMLHKYSALGNSIGEELLPGREGFYKKFAAPPGCNLSLPEPTPAPISALFALAVLAMLALLVLAGVFKGRPFLPA